MKIKGTVTSGKGNGRNYLLEEEYLQQCKRKLGFIPYPGTLNIKIDERDMKKFGKLKQGHAIILHGFKKNSKVFGSVKCFRAMLMGKDVVIVVPEKSFYTDIMEIISDKNLRNELTLKDGDCVEVNIENA